jgi:4-amino-4-deoxy-L-arabinose transferase-like glycosyltransferase
MILLVYIFCLSFINQQTALLASLLLSVSPISVLCASRIWSDSTLSFFMFTAALFFLLSNNKSNIWLAVISGIFSGLGVLTKLSGLFTPIILGFYSLMIISWRSFKQRKLAINPEAKNYSVLFLITLIMTMPWFTLVAQTFGDPLHVPYQANAEEINPWFASVWHRPWFTYPVDILCQNPIWIFALFGTKCQSGNRRIWFFLTSWIIIITTYLTLMVMGKENRYMLPAYPAIAILASCGLVNTSEWLNRKSLKWLNIPLKIMVLISLIFSTINTVIFLNPKADKAEYAMPF